MSDKAKNLVRAWQQLRKNRGIIALPEPGWEDWQAVDEAIAVECTVPAPQPTARTAEEKAAKLEELRQSYDCGNMGWSEAVGLYCAWQIAAHCPEKELGHGTEQGVDFSAILERERTLVAEGVTNVKKAVRGREWLTEGRGSYEWDDDRWHEEFAVAIKEILAAMQPLERIAADLTNCPQKAEDVQKAREGKYPIALPCTCPCHSESYRCEQCCDGATRERQEENAQQ